VDTRETTALVSRVSCEQSTWNVVFHVDSGAGQSLCSCADAFISLRACAIEVMRVSGSLPIFGVGTALFAYTHATGAVSILLLHNCLLSQGGVFNLLSVSQLQMSRVHSVNFSSDSPRLDLKSASGSVQIPLSLADGLYSVSLEPISVNDVRYGAHPRFDLTTKGEYSPATADRACLATKEGVSPLGNWTCRLLVAPSSSHRIMAFPSAEGEAAFDSHLREFCQRFLAPLSIPPARRTYDQDNPLHMSDLSIRFMGTSHDKLKRTIELNRGLSPTVGRVPTLNFPQGKFRQGKAPKVAKGRVRHLHRASICEVVFTDTFDTGDHKYRYGQAFVDYRSRWGAIIPLRSRTQVGWSFGEFVCRNFTPLILVRDNIAENRGGALMDECHRRGVQSAFICPYTPQRDQAENYLGRVTAMASYAMVYAGAPLWFWIWGTESAAFVSNITATFYSREQVWSTPYALVYGEPFPDASIVVPFGCGALVLLDKGEREKFQTRCAMLIFIHYATSHPLFTYAFYSPRTKKVLYRQDAIFLVTLFPMRGARTASTLPADGDALVPLRSPLGLFDDHDEFSFGCWAYGDALPDYADHVSGFSLDEPPDMTRTPSSDPPADWPHRYPQHEAFGPRSTVAVPLPPPYPGLLPIDVAHVPPTLSPASDDMSGIVGVFPAADQLGSLDGISADDDRVADDLSDDYDRLGDVILTVHEKDKDMTRGMGNLLRGPNPLRMPIARGQAPNLGPSILSPAIVTLDDQDPSLLTCPPPPLPVPSQRVLRDRTKRVGTLPDASLPSRPTKRKVKDRWFYQPVSTLIMTGSSAITPSVLPVESNVPALVLNPNADPPSPTLLSLCPRAPWMKLDDPRSDEQADADWQHANTTLFDTIAPPPAGP
jgi:hypothetical protein